MPKNKILAISPHADDMELGAGGTIKKWIDNGAVCYSIVLSMLRLNRQAEIGTSHEVLGIRPENITVRDYKNRYFPEIRQAILQEFIDFRITPDIVLVPATYDEHQDHQVVCQEAKRAYKKSTILGYEDPWNSTSFNLPMVVRLNADQIKAKVKAVMSHKSQIHRPYMNEEFIKGLAAVRGAIIGTPYAEAFEVIRWVD